MRIPPLNHLCISGRLTQDPTVRVLASGAAVADFQLANNERYRDKDNQWVDKVCFLPVTVWGRSAELVGQQLKKGDPVVVEGQLEYEAWEDKSGGRHSRVRARAMRVHFLKTAAEAAGAAGAEPVGDEVAEPLPF